MKIFLITIAVVLTALFFQSGRSPEAGQIRVISVAPSTTEILFALGLDDEIVGVSRFCDYPKEALSKEKIGTFSQPNVERILSLRPDIIFCTGLEQAPVIEKLRQLNLKVCVSDPSNFEELFDSIKEMGELVGKEREAASLIENMKAGIEKVDLKVRSMSQYRRPKVFVEIWHSPLMTAGKGSFLDELIALAGGDNIAHDTQRPYSYFSSEIVIKRDPDRIILTYMDKANPVKTIGRRFGWSGVSAVKNRRVYNDIDPDLLLRPGPRLIDGLKAVYERLHN